MEFAQEILKNIEENKYENVGNINQNNNKVVPVSKMFRHTMNNNNSSLDTFSTRERSLKNRQSILFST